MRARVRFSRVSPARLYLHARYVVPAVIGDHVDYRWSMGKRDLLSGHFVVRVLTDLPASLFLSAKEYRLSRALRDQRLPVRRHRTRDLPPFYLSRSRGIRGDCLHSDLSISRNARLEQMKNSGRSQ